MGEAEPKGSSWKKRGARPLRQEARAGDRASP